MSEQVADKTIRVLLVDDQPLLRAGFAMVVNSQPDMEVIGEAENGQSGVDVALADPPDVILMDIRMPGKDGLSATEEIVSHPVCADTKIVVLTTFDTDEYATQALKVGASGFLLKDVSPESLLDAIRAVHNGGAIIAPSTTKRLLNATLLIPDASAPQRTPAQRVLLERLTPRETEMLQEIATGDSNTEIAQRLHVSEATVKTHIRQIFAKCEVRDRVQAVIFAYEAGIVSAEPPS